MNTFEEVEAKARMMRAEMFGKALAGFAHAIAAAPKSIFAGAKRWTEQRRAYEELMALDDRQLRDMGLSRSEIPAVVAGSFMPDTYRYDAAPVAGDSANANERQAAEIRRVA
ncbi:MAG: DUF1127 domain-containing protein [Alphaproteobacteria bacterium]